MTSADTICVAGPADVAYITQLAKNNTDSIGFIPFGALDWYLKSGIVQLAKENDEPAGFLLGKYLSRTEPWIAPIYQACVQYDARRRAHGLSLVERYISRLPTKAEIVQLWCAADLEANDFWRSAGFQLIGQRAGGTTRDRRHLLWRRVLQPTGQSLLRIPPRPTSRGMMKRVTSFQPISEAGELLPPVQPTIQQYDLFPADQPTMRVV